MGRPARLHGKILSAADIRALKQDFLDRLARGEMIQDAVAAMGAPYGNFQRWRKHDHEFRKAWDEARSLGKQPAPFTLPPAPDAPAAEAVPVTEAEPPYGWEARAHQREIGRAHV